MASISVGSGVTTWIKDVSEWEGCKLFVDTAYTYSIRYCGDMALYYLNAQGGWDSFLIEGDVIKKDNYTIYEYNKSFNNQTIDFERNRYLNEIETAYELHTGWLSDRESDILAKNLLGSNKVYAHNLKTNKIFPVVITDTSVDYKKHKTEKKLVSYTINIVESQNKIRR